MTDDEANIIFRGWQNYAETADKFSKLMLTPPASFLPYPVDILEDALNIVAKERYDAGDREIAETIQGHMALHLVAYFLPNSKKIMTDEEALEKMRDTLDLILNNPSLKEVVLENLRNSQRSWMDTRQAPVPDGRGEIVNVSQRIAHNCEVCGRARITTLVKFKQNVSYIFRRQEKTFHGRACFRCMAEKFLTFEFVTLIGTWWGIIGCLFGPVYLVLNVSEFLFGSFCIGRDAAQLWSKARPSRR